MKILFIFLLAMLNSQAFSSSCSSGMVQVWSENTGNVCVPRMASPASEEYCPPYAEPIQSHWVQNFSPLIETSKMPYWAYQGNLLFPNLNYPGAWSYPGIVAKHYPGEGEVFAAKPNVYIESIHPEKKFSFRFASRKTPHFLATTPLLENTSWKGKLVGKDKFEIEGVNYEYLFYDVRLPKEKMQFENGVCATREATIDWMLKDLKEMKYSDLSLQDFEEHWRVKIPDYPFYCIYPQYNEQLDRALPIEIDLEQNTFIRSLYVLIPHQTPPDADESQVVPLPTKDPAEYRPSVKIQRENMFREWGVAFLGF